MYANIFGKSKSEKENRSKYETRYSIFKALGMFEAHLVRLEREKDACISEARNAEREGNDFHYQSSKKKLRLCMANIKLISEMIAELEISLELDNMDRILENYNSCVDIIQKNNSFSLNLQNASKKFKKKKDDSQDSFQQYVEFYNSLSLKNECDMGAKIISDEELELVIHGNKSGGQYDTCSIDAMIDAKLEKIKNKIRED